MKNSLERPTTILITLAVAAALAGCSQGRQYAVPASVCGVPVEETAISPFLPNGEEVRETQSGNGAANTGCDLVVDDTIALSLYQTYVGRMHDPMEELQSYKFVHRKRIASLPFAGKGAVGDENVAISTKCGSDAAEYLIVDVVVGDDVLKDTAQRRAHMVEFAKEIVPNIKNHINCKVKN